MLLVYTALPFLNTIAINISNDQPFACLDVNPAVLLIYSYGPVGFTFHTFMVGHHIRIRLFKYRSLRQKQQYDYFLFTASALTGETAGRRVGQLRVGSESFTLLP